MFRFDELLQAKGITDFRYAVKMVSDFPGGPAAKRWWAQFKVSTGKTVAISDVSKGKLLRRIFSAKPEEQ